MGKVAKKKHTTNGKPNSRLHRRAASPPLSSTIPTSKPTPQSYPKSTSHDPLKPKNNGIKKPSRHQRLRREKNISRAEAFGDRVVKKMDRSKFRGGVRRERRRGWEDVNGDVTGGAGERKKGKEVGLKGDGKGGDGGEEGWEDVHEEKGEEEGTGMEKMDVLGEREGGGGDGSSDEMDEDGVGDEVDRGIRMAPVDAAVVEGLNVVAGAVEEEEL